jgi:hypothetical protein
MSNLSENLLITVIGGVAVMAIWSAIQKKASEKNRPILAPNRGVTGLSNSGVYQYQDKSGVIDLGNTADRVYMI